MTTFGVTREEYFLSKKRQKKGNHLILNSLSADLDVFEIFEITSDFTMSWIHQLDFYVLIVLSAWELVHQREGHVTQFRNNRSWISCNELLRSI
jgi:hypothetical protein